MIHKIMLSKQNKAVDDKQLVNIFKRQFDPNCSADNKVRKSIKKIDESSKDVNELLNTLELMITDFGTKNKISSKVNK